MRNDVPQLVTDCLPIGPEVNFLLFNQTYHGNSEGQASQRAADMLSTRPGVVSATIAAARHGCRTVMPRLKSFWRRGHWTVNRKQRRAEMKLHRPVALDAASAAQQLGRAVQQHQAGRLAEAETLYRQVLARDAGNADALHLLGVVTHQKGRPCQAVELIRQAIAINPLEASFHANLGVAFKELGCREEAVACYRAAIRLRPEQPEAHNSLGNALAASGLLDEALASYRIAITLRPNYAEAHYNLGITLKEQGRAEDAVVCYRKAIALRPEYQEAHYNLGNAFRDLRQLDAAIASYRRAIELRPDFPDAHHNVALALLAQGDLAAGWAEYEWRWKTSQLSEADRGFTQPQWRGEPAEGQTLLIHAEQGFGDTIQFCRFAALAAARGFRIILEVQPPLVLLLRGFPGVDRVLHRGGDLPAFDLHCPMFSLPLALGTTLSTIPVAPSYLTADGVLAEGWRSRLASVSGPGPRIGVAWAGKPSNLADPRRSIAPARLAPLFALPAVQFVSLQHAGPQPPVNVSLVDFMDEVSDFADTAALIANLDLVISVDTAVAHLAAALGKPVWLLDRFDACWRWLDGRRDSPWYPSLRLYRQQRPGDWEAVLAEVTHDLRSLAATAS
jgi:tetratricopeptide (TPR) repeat protein